MKINKPTGNDFNWLNIDNFSSDDYRELLTRLDIEVEVSILGLHPLHSKNPIVRNFHTGKFKKSQIYDIFIKDFNKNKNSSLVKHILINIYLFLADEKEADEIQILKDKDSSDEDFMRVLNKNPKVFEYVSYEHLKKLFGHHEHVFDILIEQQNDDKMKSLLEDYEQKIAFLNDELNRLNNVLSSQEDDYFKLEEDYKNIKKQLEEKENQVIVKEVEVPVESKVVIDFSSIKDRLQVPSFEAIEYLLDEIDIDELSFEETLDYFMNLKKQYIHNLQVLKDLTFMEYVLLYAKEVNIHE